MTQNDLETETINAPEFLQGQAIDSHVHFWKYNRQRDAWITDEMKLLQQDYLPEQLALNAKRNAVDGCVAVQADSSEAETYFLVELAKTHPFIRGIVGWVDLLASNLEERLAHFSVNKSIKGYRHIVQAESNNFLLRQDFQQALRALGPYSYTYDLLIYHYQLAAAVDFAGRLPSQAIIIDHCAKPDIKNKDINQWRFFMRQLGQMPHVHCKLSGLFTEAAWREWRPGDFYPYLDCVFEAFGTDRLIFGSDWPPILLSGAYVQWKSLLEKYMENFSREDVEKIFRTNAIRFYHL